MSLKHLMHSMDFFSVENMMYSWVLIRKCEASEFSLTLHINGIWRNKLTALGVPFFGAFGQGHNIMLGKHPGFVCELSALSTQWLAAGVTVIHHSSILCTCTFSQKDVLLLLMPENKWMHIFSCTCALHSISQLAHYTTLSVELSTRNLSKRSSGGSALVPTTTEGYL